MLKIPVINFTFGKLISSHLQQTWEIGNFGILYTFGNIGKDAGTHMFKGIFTYVIANMRANFFILYKFENMLIPMCLKYH